MIDLVAGANCLLPDGMLAARVPGPFDLSILITGEDGKVAGDEDFVFYNQPSAPGARLRGDCVSIDRSRLRPRANRLIVVVSPADAAAVLGRLPVPVLEISGPDGAPAVRFVPPPARTETVLLLAELYRYKSGWKIRALGQGYADGLAGLARDFGVEVDDAPGPPGGPGRGTPPGRAPHVPPASGPGTWASGGAEEARSHCHWPAGSNTVVPDILSQVVALVNAQRARIGARPVRLQANLTLAAQRHSEDMARNSYLDHVSLDGRTMADRAVAAGYRYRVLGENVAAGQQSPAEVMAGWMDSPGHRRNILNGEFTEIGVGCAHGGSYGVYWTQVFGTPA